MRKKAFTLVELLAVIVILAIILAIAIPGISSLINNATKNSFEDDAKMVIKAVNYKLMNDSSYDVTILNASNLTTELGLSASNYSSISVTKVRGDIKVKITGQNKWAGLTAYGTTKEMNVTNTSGFPGYADNSGASEPELGSNMIPIMYYNGNWVKADKNNLVGTYSWYDYTNKKWANAVTVTSGTLSTYQAASVGAVVNEADILTYLVWIPRYKYMKSSWTTAGTINIAFESSTTAKSTGNATTTYLTHPAFSFGGSELNGFWVGKFETTGTINAITVKPNSQALASQTVSSFFTAIRNMEASGNSYGFNSNEVDTHMMLNSEWGAVAYLSMSTYGINSEIYKNNSSGYYTGRSGGNVGGSQVLVGSNEYIDTGFYKYDGKCASTTTLAPGINANCTAVDNTVSDTSLSYKASTTGTIYGVYDMSGGEWEYVMGNFNNYSGYSSSLNSGFNGPNGNDSTTITNGIAFPDIKYYNIYTTTSSTTACNGGICCGHALSETSGWYSDYVGMVSASYPWLVRGGNRGHTTGAGAFCYYASSTGGSGASEAGTRVVVTITY